MVLSRIAQGILFLLLAGCARTETASITVRLGLPPEEPFRSFLTQFPATPSAYSAFGCLAVNAMGAGISSTVAAMSTDRLSGALAGNSCGYPGATSILVPAAESNVVTLNVPTGTQRLFQVLGVQTATGACGADAVFGQKLAASTELASDYPLVLELGRTVVDIGGTTDVHISNSYDSAKPLEGRCLPLGTWVKPCEAVTDAGGSNSELEFFTIAADGTLTIYQPHFSDTACQTLQYTFTQKVGAKVGSTVAATPSGFLAQELDLTAGDKTFTPETSGAATAMNSAAVCGKSNWANGVTQTLSTCTNPNVGIPTDYFLRVATVGGQLLLSGQDASTTAANRPADVSTSKPMFKALTGAYKVTSHTCNGVESTISVSGGGVPGLKASQEEFIFNFDRNSGSLVEHWVDGCVVTGKLHYIYSATGFSLDQDNVTCDHCSANECVAGTGATPGYFPATVTYIGTSVKFTLATTQCNTSPSDVETFVLKRQ